MPNNVGWWHEARGAADLTDRDKLAAEVTHTMGDWDTGENIHPMQSTVAELANWRTKDGKPDTRKVRRAFAALERTGRLERTGYLERGVVIWRRVHPASPDTGVRSGTPASPDTGGSSPDTGGSSPDTGVLHTSPISLTVGKRDGEGSADAPAASASVAPRLDSDDVATILAKILPASYAGHGVDADDLELGDVLAELLAAGYTTDDLRNVCQTIPAPTSNPTGLLTTWLRKRLGKRPPKLVRMDPATATTPSTGQDTTPPTPAVDDEAAQVATVLRNWTADEVQTIAAKYADGRYSLDPDAGAYVEVYGKTKSGEDWHAGVGREPDGSPFLDIGGRVTHPQHVPTAGQFAGEIVKRLGVSR